MSITDIIRSEWQYLSDRAQSRIRKTRSHLLAEWELCECGHWYDTVSADSAEGAMQVARDNVDRSNYADCAGTVYIDVGARNKVTGEDASDTVTLDPEEPDCDNGNEHDWRSPYSVVRGIKENPGVWGHGAGVIIKEVCRHCGVYKITDTWAQRRDTGEQGLTEVKYEDADESSLAWLTDRAYTEVQSLLADIIEITEGSGSSIAYAAIQDDGEGSGDEMLARIREALGAGYTADWTGEGNGVGADRTSDIYIDRSSTLPNE